MKGIQMTPQEIAKHNAHKSLGFSGGKSYVKTSETNGAREKLLEKTKHAKKQKPVIKTNNKIQTENSIAYRLNQKLNETMQKWIIKFNTGNVKFLNTSDINLVLSYMKG